MLHKITQHPQTYNNTHWVFLMHLLITGSLLFKTSLGWDSSVVTHGFPPPGSMIHLWWCEKCKQTSGKTSLGLSWDLFRLQLGLSALKIQILAHIIVFSKTRGQAQCLESLDTRLWIQGRVKDQSQESYPSYIHANNSRTNYHYSTIIIIIIIILMQQRIEGFYYTGISYTFYNLRSINISLKI